MRPARCSSRQLDWISVLQLRAGFGFVCACVCLCARSRPYRTCHDKLSGGCVKVKHHADPALPRLLLLRRGRLLRVSSSRCASACGRTGISYCRRCNRCRDRGRERGMERKKERERCLVCASVRLCVERERGVKRERETHRVSLSLHH